MNYANSSMYGDKSKEALERLGGMIDSLLHDSTQSLSDYSSTGSRFDFIVGHFGITDLTNMKRPLAFMAKPPETIAVLKSENECARALLREVVGPVFDSTIKGRIEEFLKPC